MKISDKNLLNGLNIGAIEIEPIHNGDNTFSFKSKNWAWEYGDDLSLSCHLEVYANDDFSFDIYTNNIKVMTNDSVIVELSLQQERLIEKEIKNNINILTLQA